MACARAAISPSARYLRASRTAARQAWYNNRTKPIRSAERTLVSTYASCAFCHISRVRFVLLLCLSLSLGNLAGLWQGGAHIRGEFAESLRWSGGSPSG